jgi:hypothetical protein
MRTAGPLACSTSLPFSTLQLCLPCQLRLSSGKNTARQSRCDKEKAIAKSRKGRAQIPAGAMSPRLAGLGRALGLNDLLPRAKTALKLEAVLANGAPADPKVQAPSDAASPLAPQPKSISSAQAGEAHRCAAEGVRLIHARHPAQAIPFLERAIRLNPGLRHRAMTLELPCCRPEE